MTDESFAEGMGKLALIFGQRADVAMSTLWHEAVVHLSDQEWRQAVLLTIQRERTFYNRFPAPAVLLQYAAKSGGAEPSGDAVRAFELVRTGTVHRLMCATLTSCSCTDDRWSARLIEERFGTAARAAFQTIGEERFRHARISDEPFLQREFVAAYVERVQSDPRAALPPAPEVKALNAAL